MKTQIRRGVFETNSSSVHSVSIVKDNFKCSLPKKFVINCDGEFGWEWDTYDDSASKAAYLYQAIKYYTEKNANANDEKERLQDLMDKFIGNLESYGIEVECTYRFTKIASMEIGPNENYYYAVFVDENGNEPPVDGYLDHGSKTKEFVDYVLSSPENTVKFIFDNRCYIETGNDNEERCISDKESDEESIIFAKGN